MNRKTSVYALLTGVAVMGGCMFVYPRVSRDVALRSPAGRRARTLTALELAAHGSVFFFRRNGVWPTDLDELGKYTNGLLIVEWPEGAAVDGWGHRLVLRTLDLTNTIGIVSYGADGVPGGDSDAMDVGILVSESLYRTADIVELPNGCFSKGDGLLSIGEN